MIFSSLVLPLDQINFKGLFNVNIIKKINSLSMIIEIIQIKVPNDDVIKTIMDSIYNCIDNNPFDINTILNTVSTEVVSHKELNYSDVEILYENISKILKKSIAESKENISFRQRSSNISIILSIKYTKRLIRYLHSYLENFHLFNDLIRYINITVTNENKNKIEDTPLFNNIISDKKPDYLESELENSQENIENNDIKDKIFKDIFNFLILDPQCCGYLVKLIINYYQYYSENTIIDNNKVVSIPIFPSVVSYNKSFLITLFESLNSTTIEKSNLIIKNIIKYFEKNINDIKSLHIKCLLFILFIYCIRHINELNKIWVLNNLDKIILNPAAQSKILNTYCNKIIKTDLIFEIKNEYNYCDSDKTNIDEIYNKYSYLKNIDQEECINKIYNEIEHVNIDENINIGYKTILDVNLLLKLNETDNENLIDIKLPKYKNFLLYYSKDDENNKIITECFKYFMKYCLNPISIKNYNNILVNYYDILKEKILNDINFNKNIINTYDYYLILKQYLSEKTPYSVILLIIYQIIIPYMYYYFDITKFEDTFLFIYKLNN